MTDYRPNKLYRNTRDSKVMGVCAGLAEYLDVKVCFVRFLTICGIFMTAGWGIALYVVMGLVLDPMPEHLLPPLREAAPRRPSRRERRRERRETRRERKYWQQASSTRPNYDTRETRRRYDRIDNRLRNLETYMTSKKYRLDRELRELED